MLPSSAGCFSRFTHDACFAWPGPLPSVTPAFVGLGPGVIPFCRFEVRVGVLAAGLLCFFTLGDTRCVLFAGMLFFSWFSVDASASLSVMTSRYEKRIFCNKRVNTIRIFYFFFKSPLLTILFFFFLNGQQTQSRALSGHPLDKRSAPRVTRVHHQFRGKPGNPPARTHDSEITGKTRLAQGSNPGFPRSPIIAHQCLTLHQVGVEPASLKRNASLILAIDYTFYLLTKSLST
ncbi:hypothetical protein Hanom_Chr04g00308161 [Helianthus anomalus]